jgi:hypothetical protein
MSRAFEHADEFSGYLTGHLQALGFEPSAAAEVVAGIAPLWEVSEQPPPQRPGRLQAVIPSHYWIIKDEDLDLLETIGKALIAALEGGLIGAVVATPAGVAIALATLSIEMFKLAKRMRDKGAVLDREQLDTLIALKSAGAPQTPAELAGRLDRGGMREAVVDVSGAHTERVLNGLTRIATNDGSVRALVVEEEGRWRVAGV